VEEANILVHDSAGTER